MLIATANAKTQVILRIQTAQVSISAAQIGTRLASSSRIVVDDTYPTIPFLSPSPSSLVTFNSTREKDVLVRAAVDNTCLNDLDHNPLIAEWYLDSTIRPFGVEPTPLGYDEWAVEVKNRPSVESPIPPCDCQPTTTHGDLLSIAAFLGIDALWQDGIEGDGVTIGIVDGGICAEGRVGLGRAKLIPRVIGGWPAENWGTIAGWRRHGNMVAAGVLGMAPRASLYDIRITESMSEGARMSNAIAGIHWAIETFRATGAPQILCCGWGIHQQAHDPKYAHNATHPLTQKIVEAMDEGIMVLFAAGNGGQSCPAIKCGADNGPGRSIWGANGHPRVMTVGAVNKDEELVGYSSQGPAALDEYKPDFCGPSHYAGYFSADTGTSTACAVVSGVVALLKQVRPHLTQEAAKRVLKLTAKDIGPPGWDRHSGAGIVQAGAACEKLMGGNSIRTNRLKAQLERMTLEYNCLRDLYVDLAIQHKMRQSSVSSIS